uniref:Uncharacterized protein n=1 Tax=Chrysemys picta bellii TaxID=8478 RepID=A0A8C3FUH5_CHRPI
CVDSRVLIINSLLAQVAQLTRENQQLQEQVRQLSAKNTMLRAPPPAIPVRFDGNYRWFQGFVNQCWLLFLMRPRIYASDQSKVALVISLQTEGHSPVLSSWDAFLQSIAAIFNVPH